MCMLRSFKDTEWTEKRKGEIYMRSCCLQKQLKNKGAMQVQCTGTEKYIRINSRSCADMN